MDTLNHDRTVSGPITVTDQNWKGDAVPLVTISCITYNHDSYIRDAIEGFLHQITSFPIEILIHDDASTDGTASIIREYEQEYPGLILPIYQSENQYSRGVKISFTYQFPRARGKYIALCEGDDYWTDPLKLQKQVDFLEAHADYVLCHHDARVIDSNGLVIKELSLDSRRRRDFTADELVRQPFLVTGSVCFRNILPEIPLEFMTVFNGDTFLFSILGLYGKAKYLGEEIDPSIYRVHSGGMWSQLDKVKQSQHAAETYRQLSAYYRRIGKRRYAHYYLAAFYGQTSQMCYLQGARSKGRMYLLRALAIRPWSLSLWRALLSAF